MIDIQYKISVVIPVFNAGQYICRCIDSVIEQSYTNIELILIDDGSYDDSVKVCDEYANKDGRVKVRHKKNGGVYAARMDGIMLASGDYVLFVDADDCISDNESFASIINYLKGNDVVVSGMSQNVIGVSGQAYRNDLMSGKVPSSIWARFFRRELLINTVKIIPRDVIYGEDWIMNLMISLEVVNCSYIEQNIYNYQISDVSVSKRFIKTYEYERRFYTLMRSVFLNKIVFEEAGELLFFYYKGFLNACKNIALHGRYIDFTDEIWDEIRRTRLKYDYNVTDKLLLSVQNRIVLQICFLLLRVLFQIKVMLRIANKSTFYK